MTATVFRPTQRRVFPVWILAALALAIGVLMAAGVGNVLPGSHAEDAHGISEVSQIRSCLDKNGPYQVWKSTKDPNQFYFLCELDDGRWGMQAVVKEGEQLIEKTAFIPKDGSWMRVLNYLQRFATRFTGPIH